MTEVMICEDPLYMYFIIIYLLTYSETRCAIIFVVSCLYSVLIGFDNLC